MRNAILLIFCLIPGCAVAQTTAGPDSAAWQALLVEVRQLRQAVERVTTLMPQTQILLERTQLQQQRVETLRRQLEAVRDQAAHSAGEVNGLAEEVKQAELRATQETDPKVRRDLEEHVKGAKALIEENNLHSQQFQERVAELDSQLRIEQSKLDDLDQRLDKLERLFEAPPAK